MLVSQQKLASCMAKHLGGPHITNLVAISSSVLMSSAHNFIQIWVSIEVRNGVSNRVIATICCLES